MTDSRQTTQDADAAQRTRPDDGAAGGVRPEGPAQQASAPEEPETRNADRPGGEQRSTGNQDGEDRSAIDPLEEEGEIAADYLEELLDTADLDGDIDIEVREGRTYLSVVADGDDDESLSVLVGEDGEVLEALQELLRLSVLAATDRRSRLVLDIGGYRRRRAGELQELALSAVRETRETGERVHLAPLSAYERKIVHDVVAEQGLVSESEGEGAARHIVVSAPQA